MVFNYFSISGELQSKAFYGSPSKTWQPSTLNVFSDRVGAYQLFTLLPLHCKGRGIQNHVNQLLCALSEVGDKVLHRRQTLTPMQVPFLTLTNIFSPFLSMPCRCAYLKFAFPSFSRIVYICKDRKAGEYMPGLNLWQEDDAVRYVGLPLSRDGQQAVARREGRPVEYGRPVLRVRRGEPALRDSVLRRHISQNQ